MGKAGEVAKRNGTTVGRVCEAFGVTRDAYYKSVKREKQRAERAEAIESLVKTERQLLPRSGGRKMLKLIRPSLEEQGISIGRDRFFDLLRERELLIHRRRKCPRTTYSRHDYAIQPNVYRGLKVSAPGEAVVADITYLRVQSGFGYLFLLTDVYSRKIVGWELSESLEHGAAVIALDKAVATLEDTDGLIHHSDRGCQYCCHEFLSELRKNGIKSSMTDADHCAQNALAERINGILKDEFYLDAKFKSFEQARRAINNAILIYNSYRPHLSLGYKTPDQVHYAHTMKVETAS